jgi:CubicO group peptidase (beta-lactamase class C family)
MITDLDVPVVSCARRIYSNAGFEILAEVVEVATGQG